MQGSDPNINKKLYILKNKKKFFIYDSFKNQFKDIISEKPGEENVLFLKHLRIPEFVSFS